MRQPPRHAPLARTAAAVLMLGTAAQSALAVDRLVPSQYASIQAAVTAAQNGDRVVLANGTYTGAANRDIDFGAKRISVVSASNNPALCIIDLQDAGRAFDINGSQDASSVISGLTIRDGNAFATSNNTGGGIFVGLWNATSPTITNCIFESCRADKGGGLFVDTLNSRPVVSNCTFRNNTVIAYGGGMISDHDASPSIVNCLFIGNSGTGGFGPGGGLAVFGGSAVVRNCTFVGNSAGFGSAMSLQFGTTTVSNCIVWGNVNAPVLIENDQSTIIHSNIENYGLPATPNASGNFAANPLFVNAAGGNYRLQAGSPSINRGSNAGVTIPPFPVQGATPLDLERHSRICSGTVDQGAYESGGCLPPCPADFNGAGGVTVQDIFDFLTAYFSNNPAANFNASGGITVQDIFDFLAAYFTPCP